MRHRIQLLAVSVGTLMACGGGGPSSTGPTPEAPALSESEQSEHMLFHFAPGDQVDPARQEAHYAWVMPRLGVELPRKLQYFKYRNRDHMAALIGRSANGLAEPELLEVHAIFSWDAHEAVHVYSFLVGRPTDFFNEGLAVALSVDPVAGRFQGTYSGEPVHEWARQNPESLLPIETIVTTEAFRAVDEFVSYQEAGSFVEYLFETHGFEPVVELFHRGRRDDSLAEIRASFQASLGLSLVEAEDRWQIFLGHGG